MLRELAAEGALGSSFTRIFSEIWEHDQDKARKLLGNFILFIALFLAFICFIGIAFSPFLVKSLFLFREGIGETDIYQHTVGLTRILFPFIAFMSFAAVFAGALHQRGRFFYSSIAPIALNLGYIVGAVIFSYFFKKYGSLWIEQQIAPREVVGLALGVLLGGFFQMYLLYLGVKKSFFKKQSIFPKDFSVRNNPEIQRILKLMWPMIIAASASQVNVFINTNFATTLAEGSVSYLSFAFRLLQLPIGIFAVAIGMVSLPTFTRNITQDKTFSSLNASFEKSLELTLWFLLPCVCFLMINRYEVIELLFERGKFSSFATQQTSEVLFYYTFGLLSYGLVKVLTSLCFALEKIRYAMKIGLLSIVVNFVLNKILVAQYQVKGLAFSTSLVTSVSALLLFIGVLRVDKVRIRTNFIFRCLGFVLCTSFFALILQNYVHGILIPLFDSYLGKFTSGLFLLGTQGLLVCFCFILGYSWYSKISLASLLRKVSRMKKKE